MEINWRRAIRLWIMGSIVWSVAVAAYIAFTPAPLPTTVHVRFSDKETWDYPSEWGEIRIRQEIERRVAALNVNRLEEVAKMTDTRKAECRAIPKTVPFAEQPADCVRLFFSRDRLAVPKGWEYQIPKAPLPIWQVVWLAIAPPLTLLILIGALGTQRSKQNEASARGNVRPLNSLPLAADEKTGAKRKGIESLNDPFVQNFGVACVFLGIGLVIFGLGVLGYQCLSWLRYGSWMPLELWRTWVWLGGQWPIVVEWLGIQKIIVWVFDTALSFDAIVIGIVLTLVGVRLGTHQYQ
jgi:hypothetical protein